MLDAASAALDTDGLKAMMVRVEVDKSAPDVVATLEQQGMVPLATQPGAWQSYLKSELATYTQIIKDDKGIEKEKKTEQIFDETLAFLPESLEIDGNVSQRIQRLASSTRQT